MRYPSGRVVIAIAFDLEDAGSSPADGEILSEPKWSFIALNPSQSLSYHLNMTRRVLKKM